MSWLPVSSGSSTERIIGDIKTPFDLADVFCENALGVISLNTGPYEQAAWHI